MLRAAFLTNDDPAKAMKPSAQALDIPTASIRLALRPAARPAASPSWKLTTVLSVQRHCQKIMLH
jgi:hypothetical protein